MADGTFQIMIASIVTSKTVVGCFGSADGTDDASLIAATAPGDSFHFGAIVSSLIAVSGILRFGFNLGDQIISVDGNPAVSFNELPAGFTPVSLHIESQVNGLLPADNIRFQTSQAVEGSPVAGGGSSTAFVDAVIGPSTTMLDLLADGFGFRLSFSDIDNSNFIVNNLSITGEYNLVSFSWDLSSPTPTAVPGDMVTITSEDPDALLLDELDPEIQYEDEEGETVIVPIPAGLIKTQTTFLLIFIIPILPPFVQSASVVARGNGVQFSGTIPLGDIIIMLAENTTGLYTLVKDKTADTLYDNENAPDTTDVKIPNPFGKLGYIGG